MVVGIALDVKSQFAASFACRMLSDTHAICECIFVITATSPVTAFSSGPRNCLRAATDDTMCFMSLQMTAM